MFFLFTPSNTHTQALAQLHSTHVRSTPTLCFSSIQFIRPPVLVFLNDKTYVDLFLKIFSFFRCKKVFRGFFFLIRARQFKGLIFVAQKKFQKGFFFCEIVELWGFPRFLAIFLKYQKRVISFNKYLKMFSYRM